MLLQSKDLVLRFLKFPHGVWHKLLVLEDAKKYVLLLR